MKQCKICGSMAINPGHNDRDNISNLDLCDVCYWKNKWSLLTAELKILKNSNCGINNTTINIKNAKFE